MSVVPPQDGMFQRFRIADIRNTRVRDPLPHQMPAIGALRNWFRKDHNGMAGCILVLPTGSGKTFTALRFLCEGPLSDGYKVLWLAHTHQLLKQAFVEIRNHVPLIHRRDTLSVRAVAGAAEFFKAQKIEDQDDVVIGTLQSLSKAWNNEHPKLDAFLDSAADKLFVVFDEAHHAPARTYRRFVEELREYHPSLRLLGLTATPVRTEEAVPLTEGEQQLPTTSALRSIFPQGICYQVSATKLIADRILAQPILEEVKTGIEVEIEEWDYRQWVRSYGDIPEDIIDRLAENKARNAHIASHYVNNRERFGKTIIFTDRVVQCEALAELLKEKGIRHVYAVYTHIDTSRVPRPVDDNQQYLERFRQSKDGVLVNVRIATEGSDFPDVQTVFLTRQTTSQILLTQMVGRALRGPRVGGTDRAYLVSFIDNWKHLINWADYRQLMDEGQAPPLEQEPVSRPIMHLISVSLIRRLIGELYRDVTVQPTDYLQLLPRGWYHTEYMTLVAPARGEEPESGDGSARRVEPVLETVHELVMVYEDEEAAYSRFLDDLDLAILDDFADEDLSLERLDEVRQARLETWRGEYFQNPTAHSAGDLDVNMLHIIRHMAQRGAKPTFHPFEARDDHDLDALAADHVKKRLDDLEKKRILDEEYRRADRYWTAFYPTYGQFKIQYDMCINRYLEQRSGEITESAKPEVVQAPERDVLPDEVRRAVKSRDLYRCLCCGETRAARLQVDHVTAKYYGGANDPENLQTLCARCNSAKGTADFDFRASRTPLAAAPTALPDLPSNWRGSYTDSQRFARRAINFFYQCGAVESARTESQHSRRICFVHLHPGNDVRWLAPHLMSLWEGMSAINSDIDLLVVSGDGVQRQWPRG